MKLLLLIAAALLCSPTISAQDIIIKKNGDELKCKVVEITDATLKYKKWENVDGPVYNIDKTEVFKVKYVNGQSDFFGNTPESKPQPAVTTPTPGASNNVQLPKEKKGSTKHPAAQTKPLEKSFPTPPLNNAPYYFDQQSNQLIALNKVSYNTEKVHKGLWGRENLIILPGVVSDIRFSRKTDNRFIIHFDMPNAEPYSSCQLNTCEKNEKLKQREWVAVKQGMHGTEKQHDEVLISFQKIGDGLYVITIDKKVKPGEFFFMMPASNLIYPFGLDN